MSPSPLPSTETIPLAVCEDDRELRTILQAGLAHFGIEVLGAEDGPALDRLLAEHPLSVVVLDIGLPGEDGLSIARRLRAAEGPRLGLIMLTARGALEDRLAALKEGVDAYFVKPVDLRELAFSVRNLHRRLTQPAQATPPPGSYSLNATHSTLRLPSGGQVSLSATELRLLQVLALNPGEVVQRSALLKNLQQAVDAPAMQRLEAHISRLRGKVRQQSGAEPLPLQACHGIGYSFLAPLQLQP
ncbi:MAG: response regulator transcription factor [Holophagaceae bacterium]|nr:response regulator transcription factor [Holophagaceae bacterium]